MTGADGAWTGARSLRRLRFAVRYVAYSCYHRLAAANYRHRIHASVKRVRTRTYRSYDPIHVHGGDWLLERLLDRCEPGDVVVDVGANTGVYALSVAAERPACTVHAFEPNPDTATKLEANVARNGFGDRIAVHRSALSSAPGEATLHVSNYHEMSSLNPSTASRWEARVVDRVTVPLETLDRLVDRGDVPPPDHLKVDAEGAEADVLRGARVVLSDRRPVVYVEPHDGADGGSGPAVRRLLEAHGYDRTVEGDAWLCTPRTDDRPAGGVA